MAESGPQPQLVMTIAQNLVLSDGPGYSPDEPLASTTELLSDALWENCHLAG
jgi:hypothetical protein